MCTISRVYKVTITDPDEREPVEVDVDMAKLSTKEIDETNSQAKMPLLGTDRTISC